MISLVMKILRKSGLFISLTCAGLCWAQNNISYICLVCKDCRWQYVLRLYWSRAVLSIEPVMAG